MALYCNTVEEVDRIVSSGGIIGSIAPTEASVALPHKIQDWLIRLAPGKAVEESIVVALPTNCRTRLLYTQGRVQWLKSLGYTEEQANAYFQASNGVQYRWEENVARFVRANNEMSTETWWQLKDARNPVPLARELGLSPNLSVARLQAALTLMMNIWDLADN